MLQEFAAPSSAAAAFSRTAGRRALRLALGQGSPEDPRPFSPARGERVRQGNRCDMACGLAAADHADIVGDPAVIGHAFALAFAFGGRASSRSLTLSKSS